MSHVIEIKAHRVWLPTRFAAHNECGLALR